MRDSHLILNFWRTACRHMQIDEVVVKVSSMITGRLGFGFLLVRRFSDDFQALVNATPVPHDGVRPSIEETTFFQDGHAEQVQRWCLQGRLVRRGKRMTGIMGMILPNGIVGDVVAIPLAQSEQPLGVLLWVARDDYEIDESDIDLMEGLREPFSIAMANDKRLRELAALREAAQMDQHALLRRLGRESLEEPIVGESTGLHSVMERVNLVAPSDVPVLILGETGTGKELVARAIHTRGRHAKGPFVRVNCGGIPSELIDSQLFGHDRGSFTGADQSRQGWFERADGGTLFLDEIGELPLEAQVRFLRVLQDGIVERVGGTHSIRVNVRIVAATHRDLAEMVRAGSFREDLWYRLAVFPISLPPLRERRDDIPDLVLHFARRAAVRFGVATPVPSNSDIELLKEYDWPGNIRELGAVIDRAVILGGGQRLEVEKSLGFSHRHTTVGGAEPSSLRSFEDKPSEVHNLPQPHSIRRQSIETLEEAIRKHIERALEISAGQIEGRRGAAYLLRINPHTLRARMRKLGIEWSKYRPQDFDI